MTGISWIDVALNCLFNFFAKILLNVDKKQKRNNINSEEVVGLNEQRYDLVQIWLT